MGLGEADVALVDPNATAEVTAGGLEAAALLDRSGIHGYDEEVVSFGHREVDLDLGLWPEDDCGRLRCVESVI